MVEFPASGAREPSDIERVTVPSQVANLLRRIREGRAPLTVAIPGVRGTFVSALLEVNPAAGELVIDELNPPHGHDALLRAGHFHASAALHGVELRFTCRLKRSGRDSRIAFYCASLPEVIHYRQRRAYFRAHISEERQIPVAIVPEEGEKLEGLLRDISVGGIGTHLELHFTPGLEQGSILPSCVISLGPGETINNPIEVRSLGFDGLPRRLRLGGRFVKLSTTAQKTIQRYVLSLEREWLKKRRK